MSSDGPATLLISCGEHGPRPSAVVCGHMIRNYAKATGFVENSSEPDDLQAWCHACEIKFESEGGEMTEAFRQFNAMALVCVDCYASLKGFHSGAVA